ncbi:hypothetical protein TrRE_jg10647 [Triparma retinervis]|uniref:Uncharacterized protein n=1 Tax=Triparma retinervis TaxID=2557542 RepID=A0A9W7CGY1_9STRA|nr:hypothetical protein TrRE_jg10647 [Triparma retinervis]
MPKLPPPSPNNGITGIAIGGLATGISACVVAVAALILSIIALVKLLGHAWDHETSDFKVLYVPLYAVEHKDSRYDSHTVAVTHFERWEEKFVPVKDTLLTEEQRSHLWNGIGVGGGISLPCKGARAKVTKGKVGSANAARIGTRKWAGTGR